MENGYHFRRAIITVLFTACYMFTPRKFVQGVNVYVVKNQILAIARVFGRMIESGVFVEYFKKHLEV